MSVTRTLTSRAFAFLVALIAGLAAPGSAVAHGFAHHEAHEHALAHGNDAAPSRAFVADHNDDAHGHAHPQLAYAAAAKRPELAQPAAILPCGTTLALDLMSVEPAARKVVAAARPRADPAHGPPGSPRAPPSCP